MKNVLQVLILCLLSNGILTAQNTDKTMFIFGHSLLSHLTNTDETTVPHWLHHLAEADNRSIAVTGQYGFLPQHDNLPPVAQWGYTDVSSPWDSDTESFSEADFNTILITAANFVQYKPSNENYDGDENLTSPLQSTLEIIDWIENNEPTAISYIYENWPDMSSFIDDGSPFSPTASQFANYNNYTQGGFHDWWLEYHDFIEAARPEENVRLIPAGSVISQLLTQAPLNTIPILDLYEDNSPHGRPTIYFLASLVTYMAIYQRKAPVNYNIPDTVHTLVRDNYQSIIDGIWNELLAFNHPDDSSRVFLNNSLSVENHHIETTIQVYPNPTKDVITIKRNDDLNSIDLFDMSGRLIITENNLKQDNTIDMTSLPKGVYLMKLKNSDYTFSIHRIIKD